MTEDEMVGWHHQLDGQEFDIALGDPGVVLRVLGTVGEGPFILGVLGEIYVCKPDKNPVPGWGREQCRLCLTDFSGGLSPGSGSPEGPT